MRSVHLRGVGLGWVAAWLLMGCSGGDSTGLASATIGAAGGTLAVTAGDYAGTMLEIPAGALSGDTVITLDRTGVNAVPDAVALGPAVACRPIGRLLATPATLTLPFTPNSLSQGTPTSDYVVKSRDREGRIVDLPPTSVDTVGAEVTVAIDTFASFWVAVRVNGGELALFDYWPITVGNRWVYDNDFAITVTESLFHPNLPGLVTLLSLVGSGVNEGLYIEPVMGEIDTLGRYGLFANSFQELLDQGLVFLPATARLGDEFRSMDGYDGYAPIGETLPSYRGTQETATRVVSQGSLEIAIGRFNDVLEVEVVSDFADDRPAASTSTIRLWLARDVGPIQVALTGLSTTARLKQAQVDGVTVR